MGYKNARLLANVICGWEEFHGNLGFRTHSCVKLVWEGHLVVVAGDEPGLVTNSILFC